MKIDKNSDFKRTGAARVEPTKKDSADATTQTARGLQSEQTGEARFLAQQLGALAEKCNKIIPWILSLKDIPFPIRDVAKQIESYLECVRPSEPKCNCIEQGYAEEDCKWHGKSVAFLTHDANASLGAAQEQDSGSADNTDAVDSKLHEETGKVEISLDKISVQTICAALRDYADSFYTGDQAGRSRRARTLYICETLEQEALPVLEAKQALMDTSRKQESCASLSAAPAKDDFRVLARRIDKALADSDGSISDFEIIETVLRNEAPTAQKEVTRGD